MKHQGLSNVLCPIFVVLLLAACVGVSTAPSESAVSAGTFAPPTDTPVPPTAKPVPPTATSVPSTPTPVPPTDTPVPPTPIHLLVFPYLGEVTSTSAVVSWATNSAGASKVRYSLDQSYSNVATAISSTYDGKHWHSASITHLTPDTTYYYKVSTGGDDLTPWSEITFTTGPGSAGQQITFSSHFN